jgi:hypothetical protein
MSEPLGIQNPILPSPPLGNSSRSLSKFSSFLAEKAINNILPEPFDLNQKNLDNPSEIHHLAAIEFENLLNHSVSFVSPRLLSNVSSLSPFQEFLLRVNLNPPQSQTNSFPSKGLNLQQKSELEQNDFVFTPDGFQLKSPNEQSIKKSTNSTYLLESKASSHQLESLQNTPSSQAIPGINPQAMIQDLTEKAYQKIVHRLETERKRKNSSRLPW